MITLQNLTLQRGPEILLDKVNLSILPGRRIGVIGQNGCGKSSLFKLILGELAPDGGELSVPAHWRTAHMAQEVEPSERPAVDYVLDGDQRLRAIETAIAEAEAAADYDRMAHLYADLEAHDGYTARSRAEQLLHGLGFAQAEILRPVSAFSGGWRIRLNLARALMCPSDLMLLDEPTNHLDLDATLWLEQWLRAYPGTLLLISHDRDFLDAVADEIVHIEHRQCFSYRGNYSAFEVQRAARLAEQQALFERQQRRIAEIHQFVARFKAKASKARQAQSRVKELERMERIAPAHIDSPFHFVFREAERSSSLLINLADADLGYAGSPVLRQVNLGLRPGSRIGLLGPNGAGKSTLIKSLVGDLPLLAGERSCGEHLKIGYFAQHQLEALDVEASALLHIRRISPRATEQEIRNFLGGFNFHGDKALEPITPFSGGEKARLALALVVWQRPNLLLLDEPTNHLDLEMRHALTVALQGYEGALVVISHDRHLLRNTVDEYWLVADGRAEAFNGTLEDYHAWLNARQPGAAAVPTATRAAPAGDGKNRKAQRQQQAQARQSGQALKQQLKKLDSHLERLHRQQAELETALADSSLYAAEARERLEALLQQQARLGVQLAEAEAEWLAVSEALEGEG